MDFTLDSEQIALRDAVRGLLGKAYDSSETRRQVTKTDPGWDEKTWQRLAEMGALGLPFAEEDGGFGAGPVEVSIVAEEIGRVIAPEPYVEAVVLAGGLVAAAGTAEQRAEIIGALAEGTLVPAFAHTEPAARYSEKPTVTAAASGDGWTLTGVKEPVLGGARADLLIVSAAVEGGTGLFLVKPDADGLTRTSYATFDGGRAAHIAFASTPATPLGEPGADQSAAIASVIAAAQIAYGHEALGAMATALETTTAYLKTRKQFGVPLMTFQALTFRAADMYVSLELARSTVTWATLVLLDGAAAEDVIEAASRAKLQVSKAGRHIGQEAIQLHGGIGMTAEYSVGHYTSRLTAIDHLLGDGRHHLSALSTSLDDHGVVEPLP
ncbi:acyl-CoA dehydrogenase family protein [Aeromicrobium wangtongii]|uniref:Acyl-CoA dehydrogenase family protein n=1 Tax=Aeromicrobium wangtongii TaxID=2969247 RepID=A0ABY5M704_9ACTN|nr:acyl-CoA dehydrogenase family protein [Aeromicrobium wangtongii]MCD9199587.1 acyl-CoA dehydrogenase family protein [Aeromicrobium wangtongii]UUP13940.1 acyl-CoA dehydrogenase family protein [Aeromicrobium wangtongii]